MDMPLSFPHLLCEKCEKLNSKIGIAMPKKAMERKTIKKAEDVFHKSGDRIMKFTYYIFVT